MNFSRAEPQLAAGNGPVVLVNSQRLKTDFWDQKSDVVKPGIEDNGLDAENLAVAVTVALKTAESGSSMRRVKFSKLGQPIIVKLSPDHSMVHYKGTASCFKNQFKTIKVTDILDVRSGWSTDTFQNVSSKQWFLRQNRENVCFSIMLRRPEILTKSLDLVVNSSENQKRWVLALQHLMNEMKKSTLHFNEEQWLRRQFELADTNKNGSLSFNEIFAMLKALNLEISQSHAKLMFKEANFRETPDHKNRQALDFDEFLVFFRHLTKRDDLLSLIHQYSKSNNFYLTASELKIFLTDQQVDGITVEHCKDIIKNFEPEDLNKAELIMSPQGFRLMLLSPEYGSIYDLSKAKVFQNMNHPLVDYYINSSHNTYLCGHQLHGDSSIEGYIKALKHGYKMLELDTWDGADNEPVVTHGMTLVKPIRLEDVVKAINHYAFYASLYPVILSLENHCSPIQQKIMACMFMRIFGEKLYRHKSTGNGPNNMDFASPENLKGKIIIKGKIIDHTKLNKEPGITGVVIPPQEELTGTVIGTDLQQTNVKRKVRVVQELSDLVGLRAAKLKNYFSDLTRHPSNGIVSIVEDKVPKLGDEEYGDFLEYTRKHFVKVYPSGLRTNSSNCNPTDFWVSGVQAVSLNAHKAGKPTDLNDAMFLMNGNCGYVLKPDILRNSPTDLLKPNKHTKLILLIQVISGQYLPKPTVSPPIFNDILDPYVSLEIFGMDCDAQKFKTKVISNNGFNPAWNKSFTINLKVPELAFLRFRVNDYDATSSNDFVGEFSVPVTLLKEGYGHVHLRTGFGHEPDPTAVIFVHIKKQLALT